MLHVGYEQFWKITSNDMVEEVSCLRPILQAPHSECCPMSRGFCISQLPTGFCPWGTYKTCCPWLIRILAFRTASDWLLCLTSGHFFRASLPWLRPRLLYPPGPRVRVVWLLLALVTAPPVWFPTHPRTHPQLCKCSLIINRLSTDYLNVGVPSLSC